MSKKNFSFLVIGAVAALGLACGPSPEAPEVPSEPTVADIDAERMKLESEQAYLLSEMASLGLLLSGSSQACGNQYTPETRPRALIIHPPVPTTANMTELDFYWQEREAQRRQDIQTRIYKPNHGLDSLPCKALLDEYDLRQQRMDQLHRERVQAQLRERE